MLLGPHFFSVRKGKVYFGSVNFFLCLFLSAVDSPWEAEDEVSSSLSSRSLEDAGVDLELWRCRFPVLTASGTGF